MEFERAFAVFEIMRSAPSNLSNCQKKKKKEKKKFRDQKSMGPKMLYLGVLRSNLEKLLPYFKSVPYRLSWCKNKIT